MRGNEVNKRTDKTRAKIDVLTNLVPAGQNGDISLRQTAFDPGSGDEK